MKSKCDSGLAEICRKAGALHHVANPGVSLASIFDEEQAGRASGGRGYRQQRKASQEAPEAFIHGLRNLQLIFRQLGDAGLVSYLSGEATGDTGVGAQRETADPGPASRQVRLSKTDRSIALALETSPGGRRSRPRCDRGVPDVSSAGFESGQPGVLCPKINRVQRTAGLNRQHAAPRKRFGSRLQFTHGAAQAWRSSCCWRQGSRTLPVGGFRACHEEARKALIYAIVNT
jgi:hypothetical protein